MININLKNNKDCEKCIFFNSCYRVALGSDQRYESITWYFNAIRNRDLCINNNKKNFTTERRMSERRKK